jgi:hypothetical protein
LDAIISGNKIDFWGKHSRRKGFTFPTSEARTNWYMFVFRFMVRFSSAITARPVPEKRLQKTVFEIRRRQLTSRILFSEGNNDLKKGPVRGVKNISKESFDTLPY